MRRRVMPNLLGDVSSLEERQARLERLLQMIGISPDMPYTITVNDGTRNRVELGLIGADYGIKIVDNAGNNIILANGTIIANAIKSGTLDCGLITVTNLNAGSITTGSLSATRISGGTLNCNLMTVTNLNAGSITAGYLSVDRISDTSITSAKIQSLTATKITTGTLDCSFLTVVNLSAQSIQVDFLSVNRLEDNTIRNIKIYPDISGAKLTTGHLTVGGTGALTAIYLRRTTSGSPPTEGNTFIRWEGGTRIWSDTSNRFGINSIGSPMYIYVDSGEKIIIPSSGQTTMRGGAYMDGNLNVKDTLRVESGQFQVDAKFNTTTSSKLRLYINLDMGNMNIDACNKIWLHEAIGWYCDSYEKEPFGVLDSIVSKKSSKLRGKYWRYLDHSKLHESVYMEDDDGKPGINMLALIMVQTKAIQELKKEVELLKEVKNG